MGGREGYIRDVYHVGDHSRPTPLLACVILFFVCISVLFFIVIHATFTSVKLWGMFEL